MQKELIWVGSYRMGRNPHRNSIINPPSGPFPVTRHRPPTAFPRRFVRSLGFVPSIFNCFHRLLSNVPTFMMASATGRRSKKPPALPSGFQFDIPLLRAVGNAEQAKQVDPNATAVSHDETRSV